jgi:hypothetical protein
MKLKDDFLAFITSTGSTQRHIEKKLQILDRSIYQNTQFTVYHEMFKPQRGEAEAVSSYKGSLADAFTCFLFEAT